MLGAQHRGSEEHTPSSVMLVGEDEGTNLGLETFDLEYNSSLLFFIEHIAFAFIELVSSCVQQKN